MPRLRDFGGNAAAAQHIRADLTFALTGLMSAAAHAGVIGGFFVWALQREPGAIEKPSDAISVELAVSAVKDVPDSVELKETSAASAASAEQQGEKKAAPAAINEVKVFSEPPSSEPSAARAAASELAADVPPSTMPSEIIQAKDVTETAAKPDLIQEKPEEKAASAKPHETKYDTKKTFEKPAAAKASQASRPSSGTAAAHGRPSASRGSVLNYAAKVRARVASRKPSGSGVRGTVVVSFSVTASGSIGYARLSASSGNSSIDRAAVGAVRGAGPFPPPPAGSGTLSFSVPFYYR